MKYPPTWLQAMLGAFSMTPTLCAWDCSIAVNRGTGSGFESNAKTIFVNVLTGFGCCSTQSGVAKCPLIYGG